MTGSSNQWLAIACQKRGAAHQRHGIPCQDRACAWLTPRRALCVLDGRGSASHSHLGAQNAARVVRSFIRKSESELCGILDTHGDALAAIGWQGFACRLYCAAAQTQIALGILHGIPAEEFEFTLSVVVIGALRVGWLAVGDSPLFAIRHGVAGLLAEAECSEFANTTSFVTSTPPPPALRYGLLPANGLQVVSAMSDGAASRLLHLREQVPSTALRQIVTRLASGQWTATDLRRELANPAWSHVTGDDRSIALIIEPHPSTQ